MTLIISGDITLRNGFQWNETVWNPSMIQTALWLDAADASTITVSSGLVSQINDKSGNGRNFAATSEARPTLTPNALNGQSVLTYSGSQWLTSVNTAATWNFLHQAGGSEVIGVWKAGNVLDPDTLYAFWGSNAGSVNNLGIYQRWDDRAGSGFNNALTVAMAAPSSNIGIYVDISDNGVHPANSATILGCSLNLGDVVASDKIRHVVNGTVLPGKNTGTTSPSAADATFPLQLGAAGNNVWPLTGYIAEFIISTSQLSTDTRQRIEGYLAHKWGLEANLPADHPYKLTGPLP